MDENYGEHRPMRAYPENAHVRTPEQDPSARTGRRLRPAVLAGGVAVLTMGLVLAAVLLANPSSALDGEPRVVVPFAVSEPAPPAPPPPPPAATQPPAPPAATRPPAPDPALAAPAPKRRPAVRKDPVVPSSGSSNSGYHESKGEDHGSSSCEWSSEHSGSPDCGSGTGSSSCKSGSEHSDCGDGSNPGGSNPGGSNPGGSNPGGSNPGGSNPGGSNPGGDVSAE